MAKTLAARLREKIGQCIHEFDLVAAGDRIIVAVSGGKDSYALLWLLDQLRRASPVKFELLAVHLDQGQPGFEGARVESMLARSGVPFHIERQATYPVVVEKTLPGQATCFMCSRLRRGILYTTAQRLGCNKIALGHHRDDLIETLFMNLLRTGQLKTMPPKLFAENGAVTVIRPLAFVAEDDLKAYAAEMQFEISPCTICSAQDGLERNKVKALIRELETGNPHLRGNILGAMRNVRVTHLLDKRLFDFSAPLTAADAEDIEAVP